MGGQDYYLNMGFTSSILKAHWFTSLLPPLFSQSLAAFSYAGVIRHWPL